MKTASTFSDMPLSEGMQKTISDIGYQIPTPIQLQTIPELLGGNDLLGQAQTGTGKTAAFGIPLCELVDEDQRIVQALVVCPTRELCLQVSLEINRLCAHKKNVNVSAVYGGQAIDQQFRELKTKKPQIIVATPGRLFDHLRRKSIDLSSVFMIVLDEADKMLDMGFRPEIENIFSLLPEENQRIFFSATMPKGISEMACSYLRKPKIIRAESKTVSASKISQSYFKVSPREKTEVLCRVLEYRDPKLAVVFCNAKSTVDELVDEIKFRGFEAGGLHGDLSQAQRDRVMASFKSGQIRVLVATDIAARGIDIDDVELVTNYHLPHDPEDYIHRIGRTGRAGRSGYAVSLVDPRDNTRLRRIAAFAKATISEEHAPTISDVRSAKLACMFSKIKTALDGHSVNQYRSFLTKQELSMEDVAAGMLKLAFEKFDANAEKESAFEGLKKMRYSMGDMQNSAEGQAARSRGGFRPGGGFGGRNSRDSGDRDRRPPRARRDGAVFVERNESRSGESRYARASRPAGDDRGPARPARDNSGERKRFDDRGPSRPARESSGERKRFDDRGPARPASGERKRFDDRSPSRPASGERKRFDDRAPSSSRGPRSGDSSPKPRSNAGFKR